MNIYACSLLSFSVGVLLIAILALVKRRDKIAFRFLLFSFCVCGYGFPGAFFHTQSYSYKTMLLLAHFFYAFSVFIPITWLHFIFEFINKKEPRKFFYLINYILALLILILVPTPLFLKGLKPVMNFKYYSSPGPLYHLFPLIFFTMVPYSFYELIKAFHLSSDDVKAQIKYLILASTVGFIIGGASFLPVYNIPFPLSLTLLMTTYPIFMGIALMRYGLFDMNQITDAFQREKLAAIGTMAASLNHELRNPLYIAKGKVESYLDAVERGIKKVDESSLSVLSTVLNQLTRAMDIMQRFSDFAKPKVIDRKEIVLVNEVVSDVLNLVSNEFEMKKIRFIMETPEAMNVIANRRQLEEVFFNLIINACHSMEQKAGELRLSGYQTNGKVLIKISDTGCGISKQSQSRIFEPFYSTKNDKGTGLGLYITKQLVERNGGKISVKSKVGMGTEFSLQFKR